MPTVNPCSERKVNVKPLILITNDDGIYSPGLAASAEALCDIGELLIVAPRHQQTGMGRAFPRTPELGIIEECPLTINGKTVTGYGVQGSPAFTVAHAIMELATRKPDLCVSGINYGENIGTVLTCSGTIGAVLEACSYYIPGIALSLETDLKSQRSEDYIQMDWSYAKEIAKYWVQKFFLEGMPKNAEMLNINIPYGEISPDKFRITRQSRQNYFEFIKPEPRDLSKPISLKSRIFVDETTLEENSDIYAVYKDRITSVTPLNWDMSL